MVLSRHRPSNSSDRAAPVAGPSTLPIDATSNASAASSASYSINSSNPSRSSTPAPNSNGILAHLQHLLPRHALFHACIQIHQIASVPLVQGEFGVRWKVKNTTSRPSIDGTNSKTGVLGRFSKRRDKRKGSAGDDNSIMGPPVSSRSSTQDSSSSSLTTSTRSDSTSSSMSSLPQRTMTPDPMGDHFQCPYTHPAPASSAASHHRGMTPFLPLKEHSVTWSQTLHMTLKLGISRAGALDGSANELSQGNLLESSLLKLVVLQRVIPGDPNAPRNPRLGAVYLDLAEYASVKGETTRRYLLRESKTNATLKLTISMTHIGGDSNYTAPPLQKGEILGGITALLESDVYKTRPRAFDLFGPHAIARATRGMADIDLTLGNHGLLDSSDEGSDGETESQHDGRQSRQSYSSNTSGHSQQSSNSTTKSKRRPPPLTTYSQLSPILASPPIPRTAIPTAMVSSTGEVPFDVAQLPYAYGPKTTETLIDAIFNPVPISARSVPSLPSGKKAPTMLVENNPFVYYIPDEEEMKSFRAVLDADKTIGRNAIGNGNVNGHVNGNGVPVVKPVAIKPTNVNSYPTISQLIKPKGVSPFAATSLSVPDVGAMPSPSPTDHPIRRTTTPGPTPPSPAPVRRPTTPLPTPPPFVSIPTPMTSLAPKLGAGRVPIRPKVKKASIDASGSGSVDESPATTYPSSVYSSSTTTTGGSSSTSNSNSTGTGSTSHYRSSSNSHSRSGSTGTTELERDGEKKEKKLFGGWLKNRRNGAVTVPTSSASPSRRPSHDDKPVVGIVLG